VGAPRDADDVEGSGSPARFHLEQYERLRRRGLAAYRAGDREAARVAFLRAARHLYELARRSDGGLRKVRVRNAGRLVELARRLHEAPAPRAREQPDRTPQSPAPASPAARITFDDIAGLDDVKERIRIKMVYPFTHPEAARAYRIRTGGGVLLYGPPGTGKTMLGRAVASELDAPFFAISPSEILAKWVGESEKNVRALFDSARAHPRAVIFIDEMEALVPRRREAEAGGVMQRVVPQILAELDGVRTPSGHALLFMGATNEPWNLDPAVLRPGRLDEKIHVGLPDAAARQRILEIHLEGVARAQDVDLGALARRLEGYSGADVAYLCRRVCEDAFREAVASGGAPRPLRAADFDCVLSWLRPSVSAEEVERFERFARGEEP
jgi:transitional endoplasmic reticulum ATPase